MGTSDDEVEVTSVTLLSEMTKALQVPTEAIVKIQFFP